MGKWIAIVVLVPQLVASSGPFPAAARADMPPPEPPGTHRQLHRSTVELGSWEDYTARIVRVEPGDTLGEIAREHLGSFKRWKEIELEGPVDPKALEVGSEVLLPPRAEPLPPGSEPDPARPDARAWWDFFVLEAVGAPLVRYRVGTEPRPWGIGMWLVAIRHDKVAEVLERVRADPAGVDAALEALAPTASAWLARSEALTRSVRVQDEDPVFQVWSHRRVAGMEDGRLVLETVSERLLGADGEELTKSSRPPAALSPTSDAAGPPARWDRILVFLALLGAIGIAVVQAQRARRRRASGPASSHRA